MATLFFFIFMTPLLKNIIDDDPCLGLTSPKHQALAGSGRWISKSTAADCQEELDSRNLFFKRECGVGRQKEKQ
jgi:hypothetical protein